MCTIIWSVTVILQAFCTASWQMYILSGINGIVCGLSSAMPYMMPSLYFKDEYKIRAYYIFSVLIQIADCLRFQATTLINAVGWRNSWIIIGAGGLVTGVLILISTPSVKESNKKPKDAKIEKLSFMGLLRRYKKHFGLLFTNMTANLICLASFFRLAQSTLISMYVQDQFKSNYSSQYELFTTLTSIGTLVGGPVATFLTGVVVDFFYAKSEMTIPWVCIIKSLMEIPFMYMVFG